MILPKVVESNGRRAVLWRGLLCDWELSKRTDVPFELPPQLERIVRRICLLVVKYLTLGST